jgi:ssDNA-binding replication factor A large subunit
MHQGHVTKTKDDHSIAHALVADATASVNLSLWDTDADWLQPGDMIRLKGAYVLLPT